MQSVAALIIREGGEGVFRIEFRKAVWDNTNDLERKLRFLWTPVNFIYDPITSTATAFALTICNGTIYIIHPIIVLGLNREGIIES